MTCRKQLGQRASRPLRGGFPTGKMPVVPVSPSPMLRQYQRFGGFPTKLSTQVAYVPGPRSGVPDASLRLRFYTQPERGFARRNGMHEMHAHPLDRWLTPVPSTEVKDRKVACGRREGTSSPLGNNTIIPQAKLAWQSLSQTSRQGTIVLPLAA